MFTCPVCAYPGLIYPPADFHICPCCGTEFGYDDADVSHAVLRYEWLAFRGGTWFSPNITPPAGWSAYAQLARAGYISVTEEADSNSDRYADEYFPVRLETIETIDQDEDFAVAV
jgi:hypothetical protein